MPDFWIKLESVGLDIVAAEDVLLGGALGRGQLSVRARHSTSCVPTPDPGDLP